MATDAELRIILRAQDQASAQLRALAGDVQQLDRRLEQMGRTGQSAGNALRQGFGIAAGFGAIKAAFDLAAGAARGVGDSIFSLNSQLEQAQVTFESFTKSAASAHEILTALRREADITPFDTAEVIDAGKALINAARGSKDELLGLIRTAEVLAALRPEQGLRGAAFALQEATAGQFESVVDRFNLSREAITRFAAQGKTGIEIVRAALAEMGADSSLVERLGQTFEGRKSTIASFFDEFRRRLGEGIFVRVSESFGRMVELIARRGDELLAQGSRIGSVLGALFERLSTQLGGAAQGLANAFQPGLGDSIARDLAAANVQATALGTAAAQAAPQAQALAQALTLGDARSRLEGAANSLDKLRSLAAQTQAPLAALERRALALSLAQSQVQQAAQHTREAYDDQLFPLERQLRILRDSTDLGLEQQRLALALEDVDLRREALAARQLQTRRGELDARLAANRAAQEGMQLDRDIERLARRVGANQDPNAEGLTFRQRARALQLDELRIRRETLSLDDQGRAAATELQRRQQELALRREEVDLARERNQIDRDIQAVPLEARIAALKAAQEDALRPLDLALRSYRDQADALANQRGQWQLLQKDIEAAQLIAANMPKTVAPPGVDEGEAARRQAEWRAEGERLADQLLTAYQRWVDSHGGSIWAALGDSLDQWYARTGRRKFEGIGQDLGTAIVDGIIRGLTDTSRLSNPAGALGAQLGLEMRKAFSDAIGAPLRGLLGLPDAPGSGGGGGGSGFSGGEAPPARRDQATAPPAGLPAQPPLGLPPAAATSPAAAAVAAPPPPAVESALAQFRRGLAASNLDLPEDVSRRLDALGEDAAQGFIDALRAGDTGAAAAAVNLSDAAVEAIRKALEIGSPSRVFARLGAFAVEGFLEGFSSRQGEVDAAIDSVVGRQVSAGATGAVAGGAVAVTVPVSLTVGGDAVAGMSPDELAAYTQQIVTQALDDGFRALAAIQASTPAAAPRSLAGTGATPGASLGGP